MGQRLYNHRAKMKIRDINKPLVVKAFKGGLTFEELAVLLGVKPDVIEEIVREYMRKGS